MIPDTRPYYYFVSFLAVAMSALWAAADAGRRERNPLAIGLMAFLFPVLGLLVWIIFRPSVEEKALEVDEDEFQRLRRKAVE